MSAIRVTFIGGGLTFRALFDWLSPPMFAAIMIATPLMQVYFFASFGPAYSTLPPEFFATGNAVQICAMSGVYGVAQTIGNERMFGTLTSVLLSPANRLALYLGRALPHIVVGLGVSLTGIVMATLITDLAVPAELWPPLVLALTVTVTSCLAIGIPLGAVGLLSRDTNVAASVAYLGILLLSGAAVPHSAMPAPLAAIAEFLPMTNGIAAVRHLVGSGVDGTFFALVANEFLIGVVATALGVCALLWIERKARHRGDFEAF